MAAVPLTRMEATENFFEESPTRNEPNGRWILSPNHPDFVDGEVWVIGQDPERLIPPAT